jgi:predicted transcriptional regulator
LHHGSPAEKPKNYKEMETKLQVPCEKIVSGIVKMQNVNIIAMEQAKNIDVEEP